MNDNYPDDIRNYDHDPQSPFYDEDHCEECGEPISNCYCNGEEDGTNTEE